MFNFRKGSNSAKIFPSWLTGRYSHRVIPLIFFIFGCACSTAQNNDRPNVILIITDDQGYGDLGFTGNPHIRTPVLDALAKKSVRFTNFYVSPVCAPTRASLMTGRYSLRTGVRDTYNGGAMMATSEVTIAEMLKSADYRTGIFGKWHLGDNFPMRPIDQGFDESVIHLAGGMGQVGDFTTWFQGDRSYFDPVLWHNGKQQAYQGYCSDIFTDRAIGFIEENRSNPFFCYLSFNAPHTPLQVPERYYEMYRYMDPSEGFDDGRPFTPMSERDKEDARRVYAMVTNIDDNLGRLFQKLEELKIAENTLIIFMTDNGPQQVRYVAGMRGRKGSVYRGGVRVPFFMYHPDRFDGDQDVTSNAAHIDVLPTLAEICSVSPPKENPIDGRSLVPLIQGKDETPNRSLFFYWSRKFPVIDHNMALQKDNMKLVAMTDSHSPLTNFELYDIEKDPFEQHNLVSERTALADSLKKEMHDVHRELINSKNIKEPPRIIVGNEMENPIILNRNDAGGDRGIWDQEEIFGKWAVRLEEGRYDIRFKFIEPLTEKGEMYLETGAWVNRFENDRIGIDVLEMKDVPLPDLKDDLVPFYDSGSRRIFPFWVELERLE